MADPISLPLFEKMARKNTIPRALNIIILFLLLSLLVYRLLYLNNHGFAWFLAFLCESWFTFVWVLIISTKWNPVEYRTYPERLEQRVAEAELPPVDVFVTTADAVLEPPILTINTVLSLLAVDYPSHKLACYVSDDGCSPLTFYSLVEASKFAKLWVPFCKKYNVQARAPFRYFLSQPISLGTNSLGFQQEWKKMKDEYEQLSRKIEDAAQRPIPCDLTGEFSVFSNVKRRNHPTIIKVVWENKECLSEGLPHLVYISREKRPNLPHHYKAGAMNVLTRVSGLMTNAPFMLNLDCDMFVNNSQIFRHAMCFLLSSKNEGNSAFVQSPQLFYDGPKDDPFGNQFVVLHEYIGSGIVGLQGPFYGGTCCFHRRKVIYGLWPDNIENKEKFAEDNLHEKFGKSKEFITSAAHALEGKWDSSQNLSNSIEASYQVAGCAYEYGSSWGAKFGWGYGSATEDILTGLMIHTRGWRSTYCALDPPAFLGCSPSSGPTSMIQQKRWAIGLLEILFSKNSPIFGTLTAKLQFRQCLAYLWILVWGLRSIPELCYTVLPAYCIISGSNFLPKVQELAICIPATLMVIYNMYTLSEYLQTGLSIRAWWNNQKMTRITSTSAWLFGVLGVTLKLLGLSETVFELTQKDQSTSSDGDNPDAGKFTFDESPIFVPGTTILLVHLTALVICLLRLRADGGRHGSGLGEFMCSVWVVLSFWPFLKGLFRKGKYGIPLSTICKSAALTSLFVHLSLRTLTG